MGKIIVVFPGNDGKVRSVRVKTSTGHLLQRNLNILPNSIHYYYASNFIHHDNHLHHVLYVTTAAAYVF